MIFLVVWRMIFPSPLITALSGAGIIIVSANSGARGRIIESLCFPLPIAKG